MEEGMNTLWERVVVGAFHTTDEHYTREVERLKESINRWKGLRYIIQSIPPGHWKDVCRKKPTIVRQLAKQFPHSPLLFVDADAVLDRDPREVLPNTWQDGNVPAMSVHKFGSRVCSGTIILAPGSKTQKILAEWERKDQEEGHKHSQPQMVLHSVNGINTDLDPQWCWIFDLSHEKYGTPSSPPIVTHYQASREYRDDKKQNKDLCESRRKALSERFGGGA